LWSNLKSPVPMFIGIPMMMHSDTPANNQNQDQSFSTCRGIFTCWGVGRR
jgi:hypothetical protein